MAKRDEIYVAAIVFAESKRGTAFSVRQFCDFLGLAGVAVEEEAADEVLAAQVERGGLRQIGPGVFAAVQAAEARR